MASGRSSWFKRYVLFKIPGLYKRRDCGNFHPFWHRLCFCRMHEYCGDWHGGIQDLKTGEEYQECQRCKERRAVADSNSD